MKKNTIRILAVVAATALLLGGAYLLTSDDIAQKLAESDLTPYMPSVIAQENLGYTATDTTNSTETSTTMTSETTLTEGTTTEETLETVPSTQENVLSPEICEELMDQAQDLQETYPDAIGWIYIPDTSINYPIMQGEDNDFYLTHGTDGRKLKSGCIELDYRCENRFQNNFNILYGHNMKNGSMFANVCRFKDKGYYDSHPYGWVYTSDAVYRLDFFSVAVTDWYDEIYNGYRSLDEWTPHLKEISRIYEEIELTEQDRLVCLSTCSYEFKNARTVLTGRLVEMEVDMNDD